MLSNLKMPDITPAQIAAVLGWVAAQLVAFGLLDTQKSQVLVSGGATIIAALLKLSDALIRNGRAKIAAAAISVGPNSTGLAGVAPTTLTQPPEG